jgi:hypothetical protein
MMRTELWDIVKKSGSLFCKFTHSSEWGAFADDDRYHDVLSVPCYMLVTVWLTW